jgi:type II secretory pathway component PulF
MPTDQYAADALRDEPHPYGSSPPAQQASNGRAVVFASFVVAVHALLIFFLLGGAIVFGLRCEKVFRDFNLKLDTAAEIAIGVTHWLNNYWYVLVLFLLPCFIADGAILFLLHRWPRSRGWSYAWALTVIVFVLLLGGCMGESLYAPYSRLMDGLSK